MGGKRMGKRSDSEFNYNPLVITHITGDNMVYSITFKTRDKEYYKLTFYNVIDIRSSIENVNLDRNYDVKKGSVSDISIIEDSEIIEGFKGGTFEFIQGTSNLKHYYITDYTDTVVDVIEDIYPTSKKPIIEKIKLEDDISVLKNELQQLRWWKDNENISAIQEELDELRAYKSKREQEDKKAREDELKDNSFGF